MPRIRRPRRGSMAYYPRKRARSEIPHIRSWPEIDGGPKIQGFAGYKAGMTHVFVVDYRPTSTTSGKEVMVPVTVVETPPMKVLGIRLYKDTPYGRKVVKEVWHPKPDREIARRIPYPKNVSKPKAKDLKGLEVDDVRLIMYTQPYLVTGVPKKAPEIMEIRVGGGTIEERIDYALSKLGKEIPFEEFQKAGAMVDVIAVTKGKGYEGRVKRFGVKLLSHKNSKHRRMIGTQGPWHPNWIMHTVPSSGQMGYHQRTEFNKRVLKVGDNGREITPRGGFLHYGVVRNSYVIIHGTIPGPVKRLIRFRDPIRRRGVEVEVPQITYISTASKQGT
ncbi:MAG: 50S ribosomal protein L3 [Thermoplasmata archaeon]|nr:MAG: 50S ribosomal protein L3 [Thermoplasmata archaeon]